MHFIRTLKAEKQYNLNGEIFTESDLINIVKEDLRVIIEENDLQIKIEDVELIGSYTRCENTSESDLDVLVQYSGDLKDDSLFDILSAELLELNGVKIDINPINSAKDSIEDFKERNKGFSKVKSNELFNDYLALKTKQYDYRNRYNNFEKDLNNEINIRKQKFDDDIKNNIPFIVIIDIIRDIDGQIQKDITSEDTKNFNDLEKAYEYAKNKYKYYLAKYKNAKLFYRISVAIYSKDKDLIKEFKNY